MLTKFRDAVGPVFRERVFGMFRECTCEENGLRRLCVPPRPGWRCMRRCCVVKVAPTSKLLVQERKQNHWEASALNDAAAAAKASAERFAQGVEGRTHFTRLAVQLAETEEDTYRREEYNAAVAQSFKERKDGLRITFDKARTALLVRRREEVARLRLEEARLEQKLNGMEGWRREMVEFEVEQMRNKVEGMEAMGSWTRKAEAGTMTVAGTGEGLVRAEVRETRRALHPPEADTAEQDVRERMQRMQKELRGLEAKEREKVQRELDNVRIRLESSALVEEIKMLDAREKREVATLDAQIAALQARYTPENRFLAAVRRSFSSEFRERVERHVTVLVDEYIRARQRAARERAEHSFAVMHRVVLMWQSASVRRVFDAWRGWARSEVTFRKRGAAKTSAAASWAEMNEAATRELQTMELAKWERRVDPYSERVSWRHRETGEERPEPPPIHSVSFRHRPPGK